MQIIDGIYKVVLMNAIVYSAYQLGKALNGGQKTISGSISSYDCIGAGIVLGFFTVLFIFAAIYFQTFPETKY